MLNEHQIEELLRRSNPEPDAEALRMEPHVVQVSSVSIVDRREVMSTSISRLKPLDKPRWSRAVAIATSAAVVVLLAIGGFALLSRPGAEEIAPAVPAGEVSLLAGTWERTEITELEPLVHFIALELGTSEFGLVAAAVMDGVWLSENGTEWHQTLAVPNEPSAVSPDTTLAPSMTGAGEQPLVSSMVNAIAEYDGVLYAAGGTAIGIDTSEMESRLLIWRSDDGRHWDEITLASAASGFAPIPTAIVGGDDELFVYASDGAVYRSEDGENWIRSDANAKGSAFIKFGGEYVAIGESPSGETVVSHSYTSPDGITWTQVSESEFPIGHHPWSPLVEFGGALYVGGMTFSVEEDGVGAVWRSEDGRTWSRVDLDVRAPFGPSDDESVPAMYEVGDLIVTPYGMLVIGNAPGEAGNHQDIVVLATEDGITYEPVPDPDGLFIDAAHTSGVFFEGEVVTVGHALYSEEGGAQSYKWVWTP